MKHIKRIKYWALYEYYPGKKGQYKRLIVIRETESDLRIIKEALEKSNIHFEDYQIEGIE